jgi:predicted XRE-type DNA-binding protein
MAKAKGIAKAVTGNVFEQVGFSPEESVALKMRVELHSDIVRVIKQKNYSQARLAEIFDTDQPRISNLMRGKLASFNLETLVRYADTLGMNPQMKIKKRPAEMAVAR